MVTYSEALVTSNHIANSIHGARRSIEQAYQAIKQAGIDLGSMESRYGPFINEVNQEDGNDPEWAAMQGKLAKLVADFLTLKTYVQAVQQAVESVE